MDPNTPPAGSQDPAADAQGHRQPWTPWRRPGVKLAVLSCCDAGAPAGEVFDVAGGPVMTIRTLATTIGEDVLGALEYACAMEGASVIIVMGHSRCRAITAACDHTELGHLTGVLDRIVPAIQAIRETDPAPLPDDAFVERVTLEHTRRQALAISERSPVLARMLEAGALTIMVAIADSASGAIHVSGAVAGSADPFFAAQGAAVQH